MEKTKVIVNIWEQFNQLLRKNVRKHNLLLSPKSFKKIRLESKEYLIIKLSLISYIVIDLETKESLSNIEVGKVFDYDFFVKNFHLPKYLDFDMFIFKDYEGDISQLNNFYEENKEIFDLPGRLYYKINMEQAYTYLDIDLTLGFLRLGFETNNQFLYEWLYFKNDLLPSKFQDAQNKIGKEKMLEMFDMIKYIKLPNEIIPKEILDFIFKNEINNKKLIRK